MGGEGFVRDGTGTAIGEIFGDEKFLMGGGDVNIFGMDANGMVGRKTRNII